MAPKKQPNAPRTNDEALTPVATYSARGNQTIVRKSNDLIQNAMYSLTLSRSRPLIIEIPDRHGNSGVSEAISHYVNEAVGIKM